jgi:hypothetical protein
LNTIALAVAVGVLAELCVAWPVPLVFDCPALPHQAQLRFRASAQCGDEQVNVAKRFSIAPACAHHLDDPAGACPVPVLTDDGCGIADVESPVHLAAMAGLNIANHHRKMPLVTESGNDLLIQLVLVFLTVRSKSAPCLAAS